MSEREREEPRSVAEVMRILIFTPHNYGHAAAVAAILARRDAAKKVEKT
jgi:hypothetical protein